MDKQRFEQIQYELNILNSRKVKQEKLYREVRAELGRMQDKIDELTKELVAYLNNMSKSK